MTHLDLFSGIGGFALAARWAGIETIAFCEIDKFCQKVLNKNFPGVPIYEDIKELTWERFVTNATGKRLLCKENEQILGKTGSNELDIGESGSVGQIDLLTGGFPCQPFSVAGKQRGEDDNRYLWPEMLRIIQEFHPTWIIGENVAGIINLALEQVCTDLEDNGYEVQPFVIPAVALNAPHRRDRVWIVAHDTKDTIGSRDGGRDNGDQAGSERPLQIEGSDRHATDTEAERLEGRDSTGNGCTRGRPPEHPWDRPWLEVAIETCSRDVRVDDGVSDRIHFSGYTKAGHRVERLKSLGNAIVPQIAYELMMAIKQVEGE